MNDPKKQATRNIICLILCSFLICLLPVTGISQNEKLPGVEVKSLDGKTVDFSEVSNDGKPFVVVFWATWCKPCLKQLNEINEVYADWQQETGVKLIAVSIDDQRNVAKVKPYVEGKSWEYEVYLDENSDLKRAMGVNNVPHTFVVNGKGVIVWQHTSYAEGDAERIIEEVRNSKPK